MLNKQKGDMYQFVTHTWNTVKGRCPHDCSYCFMKRFGEQPELHFDETELKTDLGENNFIFVGSSCDMWAEDIRQMWIMKTLEICLSPRYIKNKYLYQSKNLKGILNLAGFIPQNSIIATTIETNRAYPEMGKAPPIGERARALKRIKELGFETMITIEPIMDFDTWQMINLIRHAKPDSVNIGADSQGHGLPEPGPGKVETLIDELGSFTKVKSKANLKRLL